MTDAGAKSGKGSIVHHNVSIIEKYSDFQEQADAAPNLIPDGCVALCRIPLPPVRNTPRARLTATHDILKVAVAATSPEAGDFASTQSSRLVRLPDEPNLRHSLDADLPHAEVGDVVPDKKPHIVCQGCLPDGHEDHEGQRLG